jgi:hypothetical protein
MRIVMPSDVVETIDQLFTHAKSNAGQGMLSSGHSPQLRGILSLINDIPSELINLRSADYADLVLARSTIEQTLATWISRGDVGLMPHVKGRDAVTVIRHVLSLCPDESACSGRT